MRELGFRWARFQLQYVGSRIFSPSDSDVRSALVALYGETRGGHSSDEWFRILSVWVNRYLRHRPWPRVWPTLEKLILNHSQPVNPQWRRGGRWCRDRVGRQNCSESRLAWREEMADLLTWDLQDLMDPEAIRSPIPVRMRTLTLELFGGAWAVLPPSLDFANLPVARKYGERFESGGNWFLTLEQLQDAPGLLRNFLPGMIRVSVAK